MSDPQTISDVIQQAALDPVKSATADGVSVTAKPVSELIEAQRFLESQKAAATPGFWLPLRPHHPRRWPLMGLLKFFWGKFRTARATIGAFEALGQRPIRGRYDAADRTNPDMRNYWKGADALDADSSNSLAVRKALRENSRYEQAIGWHDQVRRDVVKRNGSGYRSDNVGRTAIRQTRCLATQVQLRCATETPSTSLARPLEPKARTNPHGWSNVVPIMPVMLTCFY